MTMIRKDQWKLVHFVDSEEGQLFDLEADPDERENLWDVSYQQKTKSDLIAAILNWRIESARKTQGFVQMLSGNSAR